MLTVEGKRYLHYGNTFAPGRDKTLPPRLGDAIQFCHSELHQKMRLTYPEE
jgi:hypothetical protein